MYKVTVPTLIYPHFDKEGVLAELRRAKVDRVALTLEREMGHTFSSPETLATLKELITAYKQAGTEVMIWLGETMGHDSSAETEDSPYQNLYDFDSGRSKAFCPLDEKFQRDFVDWIRKIGSLDVDLIMLDDDYRTDAIPDVTMGCCCPLHMQKIEQVLGEKISPEALREKMLNGGENRYRDAWLQVQSESMRDFSLMLRQALNEVAPKTRMGFCICLDWDVTGCDVEMLARALAGDTKPFIRLSGAPYWPQRLGEIIEYERTELALLKDKGIELISEGDTWPRPRFVTSAARLENFDIALRADGNSDGILKYMECYVSSAVYETGFVDAHIAHQGLYRQIEQHFASKKARGVRLWNFPNLFPKKVFDPNNREFVRGGMYYKSISMGVACSLPMTYEGEDVGVLFGENARHISKEQLRQGCILDIKAAQILTERGIDVGVARFEKLAPARPQSFTDLPMEYYPAEKEYIRLELGVSLYQADKRPGAKVLTYIDVVGQRHDGVFIYENAEGMRFLVFPFDAAEAIKKPGWFTSYARRRQLIKQLAWLGKPLAAYVEGNYPYHYSMVKENETEIAIGIWNLFEDSMENVQIRFNVPIATEGTTFINGSGSVDGQTVCLHGKVVPHDFVGICVKKK